MRQQYVLDRSGRRFVMLGQDFVECDPSGKPLRGGSRFHRYDGNGKPLPVQAAGEQDYSAALSSRPSVRTSDEIAGMPGLKAAIAKAAEKAAKTAVRAELESALDLTPKRRKSEPDETDGERRPRKRGRKPRPTPDDSDIPF